MKRIYDGLTILLKYEPDGDFNTEHDVAYASSVNPGDMAREDVQALEKMGWFHDATLDTWTVFT